MGPFIAQELHASRGVVAGCSLATTLIRVFTITPFDNFVRQVQDVVLDNYIDDNVLSTEGTEQQVIDRLGRATDILADIVDRELLCKFSLSKTKIVASTRRLGLQIQRRVRRRVGGIAEATAPNLGADCAAGKRRGGHGRNCKRRARLRTWTGRRGNLRRLRAVLGDKAVTVFATGTLAAMVYAAEVHGLSDQELLKVRRICGAAMRPKARGRSLLTSLALNRDPTWRAGVAPFLHYTRAVWRASLAGNSRREMDLPEIRRAWHAVDRGGLVVGGGAGGAGGKRRWDRVRGPIGAVHLSLHRLGWKMDEPFVVVDDLGVSRNIVQFSPALWSRSLERRVAKQWAARQPSFEGRRICLDHIRPLVQHTRSKGRRLKEDPLRADCVEHRGTPFIIAFGTVPQQRTTARPLQGSNSSGGRGRQVNTLDFSLLGYSHILLTPGPLRRMSQWSRLCGMTEGTRRASSHLKAIFMAMDHVRPT